MGERSYIVTKSICSVQIGGIEQMLLLTVINATFICTNPVRVIQHHVTIVVAWRITPHTTIIIVSPKELLTASLHRAGQPLRRVHSHVIWFIAVVPGIGMNEFENSSVQYQYVYNNVNVKIDAEPAKRDSPTPVIA